MAIKTFTTGEVLTAADTNTYLANSGLVTVAGGTFSAVASVDITGFSTTYDNYKLTLNAGSAGGTTTITAQIYQGATARIGYYGASESVNYLGTRSTYTTSGNSSNFQLGQTLETFKGIWDCSISGLGTNSFNIIFHAFENANVASLTGGFSNYAAANSFDRIRLFFSGTGGSGNWQLSGVRKS